MKNIGDKKKKFLIGLITFLFIVALVIPVSSIIRNNESVEKDSVIEKNKLTSQVLMTGNDYHLSYDREEEIKEEMDERVEEIKKEEAKKPPQQKPETSVEIIEEIKKDDPNSNANNPSGDSSENGNGGEGSSGSGEGTQEGGGSSEDHKKPEIDEDGTGSGDEWGFDEDEANAEAERVKPRFSIQGISNGGHYTGDYKTFYMEVRDYRGEKLYLNGGTISVYVNGVAVNGYETDWRDPLDIHFTFDLQDGVNNISIIMTDKEGHRRAHSLTVYGDTSKNPANHLGALTFTLDMSNLGIGTPEHPVIRKRLIAYDGETVGHFIQRAMSEEGYYVEFTSGRNYIPRIYKDGMISGWNISAGKKAFLEEQEPFWGRPSIDEATGEFIYDKSLGSLGEKDFFAGSGWCITTVHDLSHGKLNGNMPFGVQAGLVNFSGDITLYWTNCLGYDYNGKWNKGGN